jgi:uncharacterized protein YlaN (UPF0358 family)
VNVAVYVDPLLVVVTVDKDPPVTLISELLKLVVAVFIENVTVAICPGVKDVLVEEIVHIIAVTTVFMVRLTVLEENDVVASLLVPDTDIEPDWLTLTV